jgi:hypothetical protein
MSLDVFRQFVEALEAMQLVQIGHSFRRSE